MKFTTARHLSFFRSSSVQSTTSHHVFLNSILMFSSHLNQIFQVNSFLQISHKTPYTPMNMMLPCFTHRPVAISPVMPTITIFYSNLVPVFQTNDWMKSLHQNDIGLRVRCTYIYPILTTYAEYRSFLIFTVLTILCIRHDVTQSTGKQQYEINKQTA
jgi:hypothetical protein